MSEIDDVLCEVRKLVPDTSVITKHVIDNQGISVGFVAERIPEPESKLLKIEEILYKFAGRRRDYYYILAELCSPFRTSQQIYYGILAYDQAGVRCRQRVIKLCRSYLDSALRLEPTLGTHHLVEGRLSSESEENKLILFRIYTILGSALAGEQQYEEALTVFLYARDLCPWIPSASVRASSMCLFMNKIDEGLQILNQARESKYYPSVVWRSKFDKDEIINDTFKIVIDANISDLEKKKNEGFTYRPRKKRT